MTNQGDGKDRGPTVVSMSWFKRKPELSHDEFYHHWEKVHGALVKPWAQKHGFIGYTQIHLRPELNNQKPIGPEKSQEKSPFAEFDGCAFIEIESMDQFAAAFKDEYYLEHIAPDEAKFIDKKAGVVRARGEVKKIL